MANELLNLITTNQNALKQILQSQTQEEGFRVAHAFIENYPLEKFLHDLAETKKIMNDETLDNDDLDTVVGGNKYQLRPEISKKFREALNRWKNEA